MLPFFQNDFIFIAGVCYYICNIIILPLLSSTLPPAHTKNVCGNKTNSNVENERPVCVHFQENKIFYLIGYNSPFSVSHASIFGSGAARPAWTFLSLSLSLRDD
jgi:hypothetical protein